MHKRKKNKIKPIVWFALVVIVLMIMAFAYAVIMRYIPTNDRVKIREELNIESADEYAIAYNGEYFEYKAFELDSKTYLPFEFIKEFVNQRYYFNEDEQVILYSQPYKTLDIDYKLVKGKPYLEKNAVLDNCNIGFLKSDTGIISLCSDDFLSKARLIRFKKKTNLRKKGGVKSPILFDISENEIGFITEDLDKWARICTVDGKSGYVKKSKFSESKENYSDILKSAMEYSYSMEDKFDNQVRNHKICLGWHMMMKNYGNSQLGDIISKSNGMNVISPTWFSVKDNEGNIESFADRNYIKKAHNHGIEVWGLISDINYKEAKAKVFLHNTEARRNIISSLIDIAKDINMDGINLDLESIPQSASEDYIQFVRELSIECRKNNLVLSIDNYVPKGFNKYFNRKEQGIFADYVVIMGYDEHYAGSKVAGSVASIGFVENGIDETLKEVPKEKIINGVPGYMRLWTNTNEGLKVKPISMYEAKKLIDKYDLLLSFDEGLGQYYSEYENDKGDFCQIWFEEAKSMNIKMDLMLQKDIAGVAIWRLGLETPDIWEVLDRIND